MAVLDEVVEVMTLKGWKRTLTEAKKVNLNNAICLGVTFFGDEIIRKIDENTFSINGATVHYMTNKLIYVGSKKDRELAKRYTY